jgi:hypothetical protein
MEEKRKENDADAVSASRCRTLQLPGTRHHVPNMQLEDHCPEVPLTYVFNVACHNFDLP